MDTLIGMRAPFAWMMNAALPMTRWPFSIVWRNAQSFPHMLQRNTSAQGRPRASARDTPVISSAARLKDVMRQSRSTVNTPSEMLSRIASVSASAVCGGAGRRLAVTIRTPGAWR